MNSRDGGGPVMAELGLELPNLRKLISESKHCDEKMFTDAFRGIVYNDATIGLIEKYMSGESVFMSLSRP